MAGLEKLTDTIGAGNKASRIDVWSTMPSPARAVRAPNAALDVAAVAAIPHPDRNTPAPPLPMLGGQRRPLTSRLMPRRLRGWAVSDGGAWVAVRAVVQSVTACHGMWCRGDVGQAVEHDDQVRGQLDTDEEDRDADRLLEAAQEHLASRASSNRVISMV